ncbi:MAG: DegT/DnrJ/EryC1/StrS family aminotransferase [Phycisphaerae bacterium]
MGDAGVFRFYPNKQITTGEGGMVVTDDDPDCGDRPVRSQPGSWQRRAGSSPTSDSGTTSG